MSRKLTFHSQGTTKKMTIGSITPLIASVDNNVKLREANITPEDLIPSHLLQIITQRLIDMGGSGDCFFIAMNTLESYFRGMTAEPSYPSSDILYSLLNLPRNTYIEDTHIKEVMSNYSFSVIVYRESGGTCFAAKYGDNENVAFLFNDYPFHYLIIAQVYVNGAMVDLADFMMQVSDYQRSLFTPTRQKVEIQHDYPPVMEPSQIIQDDPQSCVIENPDMRYLYQYVDSRYTIKKNNLALNGSDSKAYYKIRHNVFKTLFLDLLGLESTEEKPFSHYGIDSVRTPDLLLLVNQDLILIEFTVVKKYVTSLSTKQSRNKYAPEADMCKRKGVNITQYYPTLSLDEGVTGIKVDLMDVAGRLDKDIIYDAEIAFSNLQKSITELEFNISELMGELLSNEADSEPIAFPHLVPRFELPVHFKPTIRKVGIRRMREQSAFNMIKRESKKVERQLKMTRYNAKFVLIVDATFNKVYAENDTTGVPKNTLLSYIQNLSPELMKCVKFSGNFSNEEEPFKLYGSPGFIASESRKQKTEEFVDTSDFERYYSRKLYMGAKSNSMSTLVDHKLSEQAPLVEEVYTEKLSKLRELKDLQVLDKNWFVFPCGTQCTKGDSIKATIITDMPITDMLIRRSTPAKVELSLERGTDLKLLDECMKEVNLSYNNLLSKINQDRKLGRKVKGCYTEEALRKVLPASFDFEEVQDSLNSFHETKRKLVKAVAEPTRKAYRNRIQMSRQSMKNDWPKEMQHFNKKRGPVRVCVDQPLDLLQSRVDELLAILWSEKPEATTDDIRSETDPVGINLKKTLIQMKDLIKSSSDYLRKTYIMHDLELISRLAYTVLFYSNIKTNKDDFFYDSMGYEDVMVFIKGGKKILSTKRSRLFKVYFPINKNLSWLYSSASYKTVEVDGKLFCVTPWQSWTFAQLKRSTELYYTFSNYYCSSYIESGLSEEVFRKTTSCKVLNMYSQRRKVEIWYGYFRYIYLNSMAEYTSLLDLIDDMVDYEYDPYFSYCQKKFAASYFNIYENSKEGRLYDMITGVVVENFDLCAEKFDESILMTVAPFDAVNEHLRNLKSVLETHDSVVTSFGEDPLRLLAETSVDVYNDDYFKQLSSDDLKFDPRLSFCVGKFAGEYLSRSVTKESLSESFNKIVSTSFTEISTSKGMRSSEGEFWGQKGHDVIFGDTQLLTALKEFSENLPTSNTEYRRVISNTHVSFKDKILSLPNVCLEFDLKDKAQWKGSREIYVMSETTKVLQSPLERFFKILCSWMPNELIHKKSHVRPKFIHSQVFEFEYGEDVCTYATLDCRKWAPKSNLWKYQYFVNGMAPYLPEAFVEYFNTVWSLMHTKKVRIQRRYVDLLKKNSVTEHLVKHLKEISPEGDYQLQMHYSFMMGIFNYLSSLMHASTQLYFDTKISRPLGVSFNLLAHSDDSGGAIFSRNWDHNIFLFKQYEMFQKGLNHLMSKKKCALSRNFFEMISIMYANKRLIPMTHKFLANVGFEPKGKGWVDDISTVVSKIVELFSNGGTMTQCYYTMLTMTEMIRKFYHIPRIKTLSSLPLVYGGLFNMHPLHLILLGADAQEIMLDTLESPGERGFRVNVAESLFGEYFPGKGPVANYHIPYYKQHKLMHLFDDDVMELLKLYSSVENYETLGQTAGHYSRLRDPAYVYSLTGVDMTQIFVMTLFAKTMVLTARGEKKADLRKLCIKYSALRALTIYTKKSTKNHSHFLGYMKASESVFIDVDAMVVSSSKTCKPLVYTTFQTLGLGLNHHTINEIVAYRKEPRLSFLFPDKGRMDTLTEWVKSNLKFKNDYVLEDFLMKLSSKDMERTRSSYCFIPSGVSVDTPERFWTYINFYCTRRYFISEKRPQYFTMDQFQLWNSEYEGLKHMYLLLKIAFRCPLKKSIFDKLSLNSECQSCGYSNQTTSILSEVFRLRMLAPYTFFETLLPYAVYNTPQKRAINVWYGSSEFTLYTKFGVVEVSKRLGDHHHIYYLEDIEFLDQVYFLLQNFLTTRGMMMLQISYSINDTGSPKLGFGDLNQPRLVYPGERGMIMQRTVVVQRKLGINKLYKDGEKYTLDGFPVDFEMYQNYDLNPTFYRQHKLDDVKDLIFDDEKSVEKKLLYANATSSKTYKVLSLDPTHSSFGNLQEKYKNQLLLGSERSLTRALSLANQQGVTSYRSTVAPDVLDTSLLEGMSHKDIPVLDLIDGFSFARVTHKERKVMERLVTEGELRDKDLPVLDALTSKMGIKPTLNALSAIRVVFSEMSWKDLPMLDRTIVEDYLFMMTKAALESIEDHTNLGPEYSLQGNRAQIAKLLRLSFEANCSPDVLGELLSKLYIRAQRTNSPKFWELRRANLYASIVIPNTKSFKSQLMFHIGAIVSLKGNYSKLLGIRQLRLAERTMKNDFIDILSDLNSQRGEDLEYFDNILRLEELSCTNYVLDADDEEFEDAMDCVSGSDDPESSMLNRDWEGDVDGVYYLFNNKDTLVTAEKTIQEDYASLTTYSPILLPNIPWLGPCDVSVVNVRGIPLYQTCYPGKLKKLITSKDLPVLERKRLEAKPVPTTGKEERPRWAGEKKVTEKMFDFKTEDEVYQYQAQVLRNIGITNVEAHSDYFFRLSDVKNVESFWNNILEGLNLQAIMKAGAVKRGSKRRTNVLPGFTGNLKDNVIRAELNALFKGHAEEIVGGNHRLTQRSYSGLLKSFKRLYTATRDRNERGLIILLLSTMKDAVVSEGSDSWYTDSLLEALDYLEGEDSDLEADDIPPPHSGLELNYSIHYPYDNL
jgi:hypothetical protein